MRIGGKSLARAMVMAGAGLAVGYPITPAFAQRLASAGPAADGIDPAVAAGDIVVTGTRIARPNAVSDAPITTIAADDLLKATGSVSIGDTINDLPQVRSTYSQQNSTRSLGTHGVNFVDLYGLGVQRTLVLINGRRSVGAQDVLNTVSAVDINTVPLSLLERVDVLTGGASSIYGSDAIGGVVNFVLKDHFQGFTANIRNGISSYGDAGSTLANVTAGKNFAEGRGNVAVSVDYAHQSAFYASDRPNLRSQGNFIVVEADPAGSVNGAAGGPDRFFFQNLHSATIANGGLVSFATGQCGRDPAGALYACKYLFQPDGTLVPETGTRIGLAPNGNFVGGNGSNGREGDLISLMPRQDRVNLNLIGHFEISPAIVPFVQASYLRTRVLGSGVGSAFIQGSTLSLFRYNSTYEQPRLDNPYLSDQARTLITQQLALQGVTATPSTRFALARNFADLGARDENDLRQTFRIVAGLRGDLGGGFRYEIAGNYGELRQRTKVIGNVNGQRLLLALDSARNASGQIVCRSQIDPSTATLAQLPGSSAAILAADIAACQPLNPFGQGAISQAAKDYVLQDTVSIGRLRQTDISGYVSGDTGRWFRLPGGPIGLAVGAEYRRETQAYREDARVSAGYTYYNAIPALSAPAFAVTEGFAELRAPVIKDIPLVKEFTLAASTRYSSYKGGAGNVWTYNGSARYAPAGDIAFRATYSRSVRAPSIIELYTTQSVAFANSFLDPCAARNIAAGGATRAANCAAAGIPTSYNPAPDNLAYRSGGNPDLKPEKSDSYTVGTVLTPHWVPGLNLSIDYYNIRVRNVIATVAAQTIINQCYDSSTLANPFCGAFQRVAAGQTGPAGEQQYAVVQNSLLASGLNYASLKVRGINLNATYRHDFAGLGTLNIRGAYTHVIQRDQFLNPTQPTRADRVRGELGDPIDAFTLAMDVQRGRLTLGYGLRFIGHMVPNAWEDTHSVQGRAPENADYADIRYYPNVFYHDVRASLDVGAHLTLFGGIDNLLDRKAPFGLLPLTSNGGIYDVRGRYLYTGARVAF